MPIRGTYLATTVAALIVLATGAPAHAGTRVDLHQPQRILGPANDIDSLYVTYRNKTGLHALMSMRFVTDYHQRKDGSLTQPRTVIRPGPLGSIDHCGVHPVGPFWKDPHNPRHWVTFYHAEEQAPVDPGFCNHHEHHTRWSVARLVTWDAGRTWVKGGQVITQDRTLTTQPSGEWRYWSDDAGSPRPVWRKRYVYLFYRATTQRTPDRRKMLVARAPIKTLGKPGTWQKLYNGTWSQPGIGGHATQLPVLPATARGISWNRYLHRYLALRVKAEGAELWQSTDLMHWTYFRRLTDTGIDAGLSWHHTCDPDVGLPPAYGYGSIIGYYGSSGKSGQRFWIYYMKKPGGECFDHRYLLRRLVVLHK